MLWDYVWGWLPRAVRWHYNLLASPLYIGLLITGIGTAVAFFAVNAILIGRDMQDMVASRHTTDYRQIESEWQLPNLTRFMLGLVIALLLAIPLRQFSCAYCRSRYGYALGAPTKGRGGPVVIRQILTLLAIPTLAACASTGATTSSLPPSPPSALNNVAGLNIVMGQDCRANPAPIWAAATGCRRASCAQITVCERRLAYWMPIFIRLRAAARCE